MFEKKVLIVVDFQSDFVGGSLPIEGAAALEDGICRRVLRAYDDGDKVIFLKDTHPHTYLETLEGRNLPVEHCIVGTKGHDLYGKLKALENKCGSSSVEKLAFGTTDIAKLLKNEQIMPTEFDLCGVATDICVISNALILKSQFREVPVKIYSALCAGTTPEKHLAALKVAESCQIEVI